MQNLGLSDSTPHTQGRLKSLAWPSIESDYDVEYLTRQGFSICFSIAAFSLLQVITLGPLALFQVVFYYLSGVGIRVKSRFAAVSVFVIYLFELLVSFLATSVGPMLVVRLIVVGLLGANVRATYLAYKWAETRTEPPPVPAGGSFFDNFGDVWPHKIWPIGRYVYYALTGLMGLGILAVLAVALFKSTGRALPR